MRNVRRAGSFALTVVASTLLATTASRAAAPDDRALARAALADIRSTIADIVRIENGSAIGHATYVTAAERARNGLVGRDDREYVASAGSSSDAVGAIAHLDALLDRKDASVWTPAMQGAKINLLAAAQSLSDALGEKQMEDYETDLTTALSSLSLAIGRPGDSGVLGGIQGALAKTTLGMPPNATVVAGCATPASAPAYGVADGNLIFVSVARGGREIVVPPEVLVDHLRIDPKAVVLFTRPQNDIARVCAAAFRAAHRDHPVTLRPMPAHARAANVPLARFASLTTIVADDASAETRVAVAPPATGTAASGYTTAQARAGSLVYAKACISCHGANLQGVAGPAVAGKAFLASVKSNKWTYADFRNLVVQQMPLNNPGSLTPTQYASVLAFLLAENCFPASKKPFPENDAPALAKTKLVAPTAPVHPTDAALGTCAVR